MDQTDNSKATPPSEPAKPCSRPARCSAAGSALADVEAALKLVKDSYIHDNKHRLGALGCADMDMVEEYLSSARGKLLNAEAHGLAEESRP